MRVLRGAARAAGRILRNLGQSGSKPKVSTRVPSSPRKASKDFTVPAHNDRREALQAKFQEAALFRNSPPVPGQLVGASSRSLLNVNEASLAQQDQVKVLFGRMLGVVHNVEETIVNIAEFQRLLQDAATADLFAVWPFRGSNTVSTNMVTAMFYLPDIIHASSVVQRFDTLFPYLNLLFSTASAAVLQPNRSPTLHEALSLLAEAHDLPETSQQTRQGIARLLGQWGIMRVPIANDVGVWSSEPQPSRIGTDSKETVLWVVGALHAQRTCSCDCSPSAALQLGSLPPTRFAEPANAPQGLYTAEAVQAIVEKAVQEAVAHERDTQRVLMVRPNGRFAIKDYMRARTLHYSRDFNLEMLAKRREREVRQRELENDQFIDPMPFTSVLESADNGTKSPYL